MSGLLVEFFVNHQITATIRRTNTILICMWQRASGIDVRSVIFFVELYIGLIIVCLPKMTFCAFV